MIKVPDASPSALLNTCFVTNVLHGYDSHDADSAYVSALASITASIGHNVTLAWVPSDDYFSTLDPNLITLIKKEYRENHQVNLEVVRSHSDQLPGIHTCEKASAAAFLFSRDGNFDFILVSSRGGIGYYSIIGHRMGLLEEKTRLVLAVSDPHEWKYEKNKLFSEKLQDISALYMEKYCIEQAEELIFQSSEIHEWLIAKGWKTSGQAKIMPAFSPVQISPSRPELPNLCNEIAFIGDHDRKSGFLTFCNALEELSRSGFDGTVTFLGEFNKVDGAHSGGMVLRMARSWPCKIKFFPKAGGLTKLSYLRDRNILAVIPESGCEAAQKVADCLHNGIAFVVFNSDSVKPLISQEDRETMVCADNAADLAEKLRSLLKAPLPKGTPSREHFELRDVWSKFLEEKPKPSSFNRKNRSPLVSIVLVHHERPDYLLQAVRSIESQDYKNIEVIIVDDGSNGAASIQTLEMLERRFEGKKGWKLIRASHEYLGAARNRGIRSSKGQYILFMDDDNTLFPFAVSTFVNCMERTGSDIITCFAKVFYDRYVPDGNASSLIHFYPLGGSLDLALLKNTFGDANAMIRRNVVDKIGYQIEDYGYISHDWEYFSRAVLSGLKLMVIPVPLYCYRSSPTGMYRSGNWFDARSAILNVFKDENIRVIENFIGLAISQNVTMADKESRAYNLGFDIGSSRERKLSSCLPNSDEALRVLAEIAGLEGRVETSLILYSEAGYHEMVGQLNLAANEAEPSRLAVTEFGHHLLSSFELPTNSLMHFDLCVKNEDNIGNNLLFYTDEPNKLFVEARGAASIAVYPYGAPAGTGEVSAVVSLAEELASQAEFIVMLLEPTDNAVVEACKATVAGEGSSGWCRVGAVGDSQEVTAKLQVPSANDLNIVIGVRPAAISDRTLGCFEAVNVKKAVHHRPRRGAPSTRQRAKRISDDDLKNVTLLTPYPAENPLILVQQQAGIFLRPHKDGPVVCALDRAFPPLAQRLVCSIEVAHEEASSFEFACALCLPGHTIDWRKDVSRSAFAFSGWVKVMDKFKLHKLAVRVPYKRKQYLQIQLAVRLPEGSSPTPSNCFWRKLVVSWDD